MKDAAPKATITLNFRTQDALAHVDDPIHKDLSAATRLGNSLFVCCDETAGVDRLSVVGKGWGKHVHFNLGELLDLPDGPDGEMDIEGLSCDGAWLWVAGSHSLKRNKPELDDNDSDKALHRMRKIKCDPNRYFLGRFPLVTADGGLAPVATDGDRHAACVKMKKARSKLMKWLSRDKRLAPFLSIPSKENGFDVEGIVATGDRVWLGLRGPVLRGHGAVVELEMKMTGKHRLKARRIDGKRRYRLHLFPTAGQGIRDMAADGDDILLLTGPTMAGDGPSEVLRWRGAGGCRRSAVHSVETAPVVGELPYRGAVDHPEGLVEWPEKDGWLVVYDSPAAARLRGDRASVTADIWSFG